MWCTTGLLTSSYLVHTIYTKDLKRIAHSLGLSIQLYADDGQLYIEFNVLDSADVSLKIQLIEECITEIKKWMVNYFMKLNESKTEFILIGNKGDLEKCKNMTLTVNGVEITQTDFKGESAKSLGVKLDDCLSMKRQVNSVVKKCYWTLTNLKTFSH